MNLLPTIPKDELYLAPLAGLTDRAFRLLCREAGAGVTVSEMVSADGLLHDSRKTFDYMLFDEAERPYGIQLFGSDPRILARAAEIAAGLKPDFIDLNLGCPVKKVIKRNAGSALMRDPELAGEIVREMKRALDGSGIPLTAKIRSGWDAHSINAPEVAKRLEQAGLDLIAVHPRTRSQMYAGHADWSVIAAVVKAVTIPVVGNGDLHSAGDVLRMRKETGCHAFMIGRGAIGHPWVFGEIRRFFLTGAPVSTSHRERLDWIRRHIGLVTQLKDEHRAAVELRVHLSAYTKGLPGGAVIRETIQRTTDLNRILDEMQRLYHG